MPCTCRRYRGSAWRPRSPFSDIDTAAIACPKMASRLRSRVGMREGMDRTLAGSTRRSTARDPRFDGVFFVGVTSTGIYCRPICPAKTPKAANCRFFDTPQEAEQAGFRPCLRCRPELAPGSAPVDDAQRIAQLIVQRLEEGHARREGRPRGDRRSVRAQLAADSPHRPEGARRAADPAAADAPAAAGQTAADRDDAADDRGRLRQRLLQPAPVQRRVQQALSACRRRGCAGRRPKASAAIGRRARRRRCSSPIVRPTTGTACSRFSPPARSSGVEHVTDDVVRPDRAAGRREGLDPGDAVAEDSTR